MEWNIKKGAPKIIRELKLSGIIKDEKGKKHRVVYFIQNFGLPIVTKDTEELLIELI